jgi:hypothetical protein
VRSAILELALLGAAAIGPPPRRVTHRTNNRWSSRSPYVLVASTLDSIQEVAAQAGAVRGQPVDPPEVAEVSLR